MRLVPLAVLFAACGGKDEDSADTDAGTEIPEDTSPTGDTSTVETGLVVDGAFFSVTALFGFDDVADQHVRYVAPGGGPTPISVLVTLYDSSVASGAPIDENTTCTVTLEHDGQLPVAPWVEAHGAWIGFDLPSTATIQDGCRNYVGLPPGIQGNAGAAIAQWSWGIGVGQLDPVMEEQLDAQLSDSEWAALEPNVVGGALVSSFFAGATGSTSGDGFTAAGFTLGYAVDGNFEVEVSGTGSPIPLARTTIRPVDVVGPGVATGYYEVAMGAWDNAAGLAGPAQ